MTPWPELAGEVTGAPLTPRRGCARRLVAGLVRPVPPPPPPAAPLARASWTWRSASSVGCCHLNLGTPMRPRWGTCCTIAGIPGRPPTRTWPPMPPTPRTAGNIEMLELRRVRGRCEGRQSEKYPQQTERISEVISVNWLEIGRKPLPVKRQHISGRIYLYTKSKYTRLYQTNIAIIIRFCSRSWKAEIIFKKEEVWWRNVKFADSEGLMD